MQNRRGMLVACFVLSLVLEVNHCAAAHPGAAGHGLSLLDESARMPAGERGAPPAGPRVPLSGQFVAGFNVGWLRHHYGTHFLDNYDEREWIRLMDRARDAGGTVLRVWLFEGFENAAIDWAAAVREPAAGVPPAIDARFLANLERTLVLARERKQKLYVTIFTGNVLSPGEERDSEASTPQRHRWWNIIHDKYSAGAHFRRNVLAPVLDVLVRHREAVYAIDLVNEVNAWVRYWMTANGWQTVTQFVRDWRDFIHARAPIPVTASIGHHTAFDDLSARRIPVDAVDFYDVHFYENDGDFPEPRRFRAFVQHCPVPIVLGEFGQDANTVDDALQSRVTRAFLDRSREAGVAAAFAWRLADIGGDGRMKPLSFEHPDGTPRPALAAFREGCTSR